MLTVIVQTGPKGVLKDWQRYKQLENEKREEQEAERLALMKKLSLTCQTSAEQEAQKQREQQLDDDLDRMFGNDPILAQYMQKRMQEMMQAQAAGKQRKFGQLYELRSGAEFLEAIDNKNQAQVTIICHIYCKDISACTTMNGCLRCLAEDYTYIKFCAIEASSAGMSKHFVSAKFDICDKRREESALSRNSRCSCALSLINRKSGKEWRSGVADLQKRVTARQFRTPLGRTRRRLLRERRRIVSHRAWLLTGPRCAGHSQAAMIQTSRSLSISQPYLSDLGTQLERSPYNAKAELIPRQFVDVIRPVYSPKRLDL